MKEIEKPAIIKEHVDLKSLAKEINTAHRRSQGAAIEVGKMLIKAKAACGHGSWLPWLAKNVAFAERTARYYMELAESKSATVADLPGPESGNVDPEKPVLSETSALCFQCQAIGYGRPNCLACIERVKELRAKGLLQSEPGEDWEEDAAETLPPNEEPPPPPTGPKPPKNGQIEFNWRVFESKTMKAFVDATETIIKIAKLEKTPEGKGLRMLATEYCEAVKKIEQRVTKGVD